MKYTQQIKQFKADCKSYLYHKGLIESIEKDKSYLLNYSNFDEAMYDTSLQQQLQVEKEITEFELVILRTAIEETEEKFKTIEHELGKEYRNILFDSLVKGETQEKVAEKHYIHSRSVQYRCKQCYKVLFS